MRLDNEDDDEAEDLTGTGTSVTVDIDVHINVHDPTQDLPNGTQTQLSDISKKEKENGPDGLFSEFPPKGLGSYSVSYLSHLGEITARTDEYL